MAVFISSNEASTNTSEGFNKTYMAASCMVAALGGLLFGFDLVIISGAVPFFTTHFELNAVEQGWAVGCINLGCAIGALIGGRVSDLIGRRKSLILCALLFAVTGVGTGWAFSFESFIFFRLLSGVAVGAAALVAPMYISEISPSPWRGRLVSFYQLAIVTGLLLAYVSNYLLLNSGEDNWRWMFSSQAVPALLFFIGLFFVPESPRWLVGKNKEDAARAILKKVGGEQYAAEEVLIISKSFSQQTKEKLSDVFKPGIRGIIGIGIGIAVFSQVVGQNSVLSYAPEIFKQAGASIDSSFQQSILVGLIFFVFTFVAIATVDKAGRRKLLLWGSSLLALASLAIALCFHFNFMEGNWILVFILTFIGIYAATLGPVTWVLLSEMFPNRVRGNAMALATLALWLANFVTTASFPILKENYGLAVTFGIHALVCVIYLVFVFAKVPETKNKRLEEIEEELMRKAVR